MQEPYRKGVAHHPDPESCAGGRKGAGEALTGAHAGRAIELRNHQLGVPTSSRSREGHTNASDKGRELSFDTPESKTYGMCENSLHGNRETPQTPHRIDEGRSEKATSRTADMYVSGESDGPHSTEEAGEQNRRTDRGARGGKGTDQGER